MADSRPEAYEFSFAALGPALTRVTVEHRGWEAMTDEQLAQDCALPGGYSSGAYSAGWTRILDRFAATLGASGGDGPGTGGPGPGAGADHPGGSLARKDR